MTALKKLKSTLGCLESVCIGIFGDLGLIEKLAVVVKNQAAIWDIFWGIFSEGGIKVFGKSGRCLLMTSKKG